MADSCEANFHFKREPHPEADQIVRHGVYVPALPRHSWRGSTPNLRTRIGAVEWRAGQLHRAIAPDGVTAEGFSSSESAAGFLLGRWLRPDPMHPAGDAARFGDTWARRVNTTLLAHAQSGTGVTVELPGMRIHITVDAGGSVVIELDSQDGATVPRPATADDLNPWTAALLMRDVRIVHFDAPAPHRDDLRRPLAVAEDSAGKPVPDVFTQIAAAFDDDCTDLIVAEHRAAHDSGARHSLEAVLGWYDLTIEELQSGGEDPDGDGPEDQERPGSRR